MGVLGKARVDPPFDCTGVLMYLGKARKHNHFGRTWLHGVHARRITNRVAILVGVFALLGVLGHYFGQYVPYWEGWEV